jgi:gamma-glutamyltranspeptidase/glutathione hydrolase
MKCDRRSFLKRAAGGIAATGALSWGVLPPSASVWTDAEERRKLVAEAHFGLKTPAASTKGMVICSHPLATREAVLVLKGGGNACDAALCASITQTVVEPHMTGITGILSMLYYDAATQKTTYVNGNMNAPLQSLAGFNVNDLGTGRGVSVPGFWGGFEAALKRHGTRPKKEIMAAAIRYAREGFEIHPFLWGEMFEQSDKIGRTEEGREIFLPAGALLRPGDTLYQKRAAETLERLAEEGNDFFYRGDFAKDFCRVVQEAGGVITPKDMEAYQVRWMEPARGTYRGYEIAASPPPDNGGTHIIEALNMIELLDLKRLGPPTDSPEVLVQMLRIHNEVYTEGAKQPDPETHPLPLDVILSKKYAEMRFELLQMGVPRELPPGPAAGSNHVTVTDGSGNIATIIHSCMSLPWSNGLFTRGVTVVAGGAHFFRIMPRPGYRATTYLAPNIIFKDGRPVLASGSPSVSLLANILQNTINILDFGVPIEKSVNRPRFGGSYIDPRNMIETDFNADVRKKAERKGVVFNVISPWHWNIGSFEGISVNPDTGVMTACGDPRRCSKAEGV